MISKPSFNGTPHPALSRKGSGQFIFLLLFLVCTSAFAEDGYRLWLRYDKVDDPVLLETYRQAISSLYVPGRSDTEKIIVQELKKGLSGLLGRDIPLTDHLQKGSVVVATLDFPLPNLLDWPDKLKDQGPEGYFIRSLSVNGDKITVISSA